MTRCIICDKPTGLFSHKTSDGAICGDCEKGVPACFVLSDMDRYTLKRYIDKGKERANIFEATAYYGDLYLDSVHSMFCYSRKGKDGTPLSYGDIYKVTELKEIGLYSTNPRNISKNGVNIVCDVKLSIKTDDIHTQYVIAQNKPCRVTDKGGNKVECADPAELAMIRTLLAQMFEDVRQGLGKKAIEIQKLIELSNRTVEKPKEQLAVEWARGVLHLENEDCTFEQAQSQYRTLSHLFHPDLHPELSDTDMQMINAAYEILKKSFGK